MIFEISGKNIKCVMIGLGLDYRLVFEIGWWGGLISFIYFWVEYMDSGGLRCY